MYFIYPKRLRAILRLTTFLLLCLLFWQCEKPDQAASIDLDSFSNEDQVAIGRTMQEQLLNMPNVFPILSKEQHKCAYDRIEILFNTLLNTSVVQKRRDFDWDVHLIDNDDIQNAFILPGGHLFVYSGLVKYLQTESELVAVLGNEIAYADKEFILTALIEAHGNVTMSNLSTGRKVPNLVEILTTLPNIEYDEQSVFDADAVSISLICPFQYDATSLKRFIEKADQSQIAWIRSKKGDMNERVQHIETLSARCGTDEATFEERYMSFKKNCLQ